MSSASTCSGNALLARNHNSGGSEGDLQQLVEQRKRKRMQSNRESAKRSRMRKQQHLEDLTAQMTQLVKENQGIATKINVVTRNHLNVESQNSVLRAQMMELSQRLQSLNEIMLNNINSSCCNNETMGFDHANSYNNDSWNLMYVHQPIMAIPSADMYQFSEW